jgi:hypothetical protein
LLGLGRTIPEMQNRIKLMLPSAVFGKEGKPNVLYGYREVPNTPQRSQEPEASSSFLAPSAPTEVGHAPDGTNRMPRDLLKPLDARAPVDRPESDEERPQVAGGAISVEPEMRALRDRLDSLEKQSVDLHDLLIETRARLSSLEAKIGIPRVALTVADARTDSSHQDRGGTSLWTAIVWAFMMLTGRRGMQVAAQTPDLEEI